MSQRAVITGSSGYLGALLVQRHLDRGDDVLGIDINTSKIEHANYSHLSEDVASRVIEPAVIEFMPDLIIHAAFVFKPMRNQRRMREINIGAFENLLRVVTKVAPAVFHVVSSATVFGASPQHRDPMSEECSFHPTGFQYASDKQEIENRLSEFAEANKGIATSWSRPCLIGGPNLDNYMSRFIFGMPFLPLLDGSDIPLQFVHEDDAVGAIIKIVDSGRSGPFNVGPEDFSPLSVIAERSDRRSFRLPYWLCYGCHWLAWISRLPIHESPPALLEYARHPWLIDASRLTNELGFQFQYSSDQTLDIMIEHLRR